MGEDIFSIYCLCQVKFQDFLQELQMAVFIVFQSAQNMSVGQA
jgi:hypothetical protein